MRSSKDTGLSTGYARVELDLPALCVLLQMLIFDSSHEVCSKRARAAKLGAAVLMLFPHDLSVRLLILLAGMTFALSRLQFEQR